VRCVLRPPASLPVAEGAKEGSADVAPTVTSLPCPFRGREEAVEEAAALYKQRRRSGDGGGSCRRRRRGTANRPCARPRRLLSPYSIS
jgi:hypothetical protein